MWSKKMAKRKTKIPKRSLSGNALKSRFFAVSKKSQKKIKKTNTRFLGTIKEGMYLYIHKQKIRKNRKK